MWITGSRGVLMENAVAAVAAVWPWEPGAVSPTGTVCVLSIYLFCMHYRHDAHGLTVKLFFPAWIQQVRFVVRFVGTDCILILKECLEVTRTWTCLRSEQSAGRGPLTLNNVSLMGVGCWRGSAEAWTQRWLKQSFSCASHLFQWFKVSLWFSAHWCWSCFSLHLDRMRRDEVTLAFSASFLSKLSVHSSCCCNPAGMFPHVVICVCTSTFIY